MGEQVGGEKVDGWVMDESVDGWVGMGDLVDGGVDGGRLRELPLRACQWQSWQGSDFKCRPFLLLWSLSSNLISL